MTIKKKLLLSVVMMALIVSGLVIFGAITINSFQETSLIPEGGAMAIQSDTNSSLMAFYITGGIIVLMILAVGYLMMKSVVTPLNYAKVVADEIATGNLKAE